MKSPSADRYLVETPENIRFGYDIADIGSRFLAILIDSLLQGAIYLVLFFAVVLLAAGFSAVQVPRPLSDGLTVAFVLVLFLVQFGYFLFFEIILNGQTPGKRLFGLRVVKENALPLSSMDSIVRNLVRIIDFFPFAYGIGVLAMFSNKRAKRLGDFAAGTLVVKMKNQIRLSELKVSAAPDPRLTNLTSASFTLGDEDIALAKSFLGRRDALVNRDDLELQLAARFAQKMNLPSGEIPMNQSTAAELVRRVAGSSTSH